MKSNSQDIISILQENTEEAIAARLAEIDARVQAATPGPWESGDGTTEAYHYGQEAVVSKGHRTIFVHPTYRGVPFDGQTYSDNRFIAHSREDIPWLRNLVRELQACNARQAQVLKDAQVGWVTDVACLSLERDAAYKKGREDLLNEQYEERCCDEECR